MSFGGFEPSRKKAQLFEKVHVGLFVHLFLLKHRCSMRHLAPFQAFTIPRHGFACCNLKISHALVEVENGFVDFVCYQFLVPRGSTGLEYLPTFTINLSQM